MYKCFFFDVTKGKASDTHVQVGPGQNFVWKAAAGHFPENYVVVLHEDDEYRLSDPMIWEYLRDYTESAPEGSNLAQVLNRTFFALSHVHLSFHVWLIYIYTCIY